ncbi:MAG: hypothetical protein EBQ98_02945 [Actinobacteria bacterium]|nr:hypothetical protein [Actinomycetota bacterium]
MDYYAFLDSNNVVTEIVAGKDQGSDSTDWEQWYGEFRGQVCKRSRTDGFRKNYAGIGFTYDAQRDAFIPPQPFLSWTLNETTCLWGAPTPIPTDGKFYVWDEPTTSWVVIDAS